MTPSPSPSPAQAAANEAADAYIEGRTVAENMLVDGPEGDVREKLAPYFSGDYLAFWEQQLAELEREKLDTEGAVKIDVVSAGNFSQTAEGDEIYLSVCVDFTNVVTTNQSGQRLERNSDYALETVRMVSTSSKWVATAFGSEKMASLSDSECDESFAE